MLLHLHDDEEGNSLHATIRNISYLYQAEQWVIDTHNDPDAAKVIRWELYAFEGGEKLLVWERPVGSTAMPEVIFGDKAKVPNFTEHAALAATILASLTPDRTDFD